jgi:hypothetical protein
MSSPLFDVPSPADPDPSRWRRPGWPTAAAMLVVGLALGALLAPREVQTIAVPASPSTPTQPATSSPDPVHEPERAATIAVNSGQGTIRVSVETATLDGHGRAVVRAKVENIGKTPFESGYLAAELEDDQGRRFAQRGGTVEDLAPNGEINPGESPVVTFRFQLPAEAGRPAVLYVVESPGGGEPVPVALP